METKKHLLALIAIGVVTLFGTAIAQGYSYQKDTAQEEYSSPVMNEDGYYIPMINVFNQGGSLTTAPIYVNGRLYGRSPLKVTIDSIKTIEIKDMPEYKDCTVIVEPINVYGWHIVDDLYCKADYNDLGEVLDIYLERASTTTTTLAPSTGYTYQRVRTVKVTPNNIRVNVGTTKFRINKNTGSVTRKTGTAWNYKKTATITGNLISAKLKGTQVTLNKNTGRILYTKKA